MELKIPPVVQGVFYVLVMYWIAGILPEPELPVHIRGTAALLLAGAGVALAVTGVVTFRTANTTINPTRPESASRLVTSGVYRVTRNPMYLGMLLALLGWALFLWRWPALLPLPMFVFTMNRFQIIPEERAMATLFGVEFIAYRARVRRWL